MHPKEPLFRVINPSPLSKVLVDKVEVQSQNCTQLVPAEILRGDAKELHNWKTRSPPGI